MVKAVKITGDVFNSMLANAKTGTNKIMMYVNLDGSYFKTGMEFDTVEEATNFAKEGIPILNKVAEINEKFAYRSGVKRGMLVGAACFLVVGVGVPYLLKTIKKHKSNKKTETDI
jgi:hypothetical protein